MIPIDTLLNVYVDVNILLLSAVLLWVVLRFAMAKFGLAQAFGTQLILLKGLLFMVVISPLFVLGHHFATQAGWIGSGMKFNLSDFIVAQYLNGSFEMRPTEFEQVLALRETLIQGVLTLKSSVMAALAAVFALGFLALTYRMARSIVRLHQLIRESYAWRRFGTIELRVSEATHVPFSTRGLRTRFIVIPAEMLTQSADLKMALAHEFQHIRQGDLEWEIAFETLKPLFFWNPAFVWAKRKMEHLRELACDQQVLSRARFDVKAYCECLLRVCKNSIRGGKAARIAVPKVAFVQVDRAFFTGNSVRFLRYRITSMLVSGPRRIPRGMLAVVFVPASALILLSAVAIQGPSDWSQDRLMLSAIVNLERLDAINGAVQP